jgi:hypothetical protein
MDQFMYDAFISYRHHPRDKAVAEKLQKRLESYRPPKNGTYKNTAKISKVFRDESELPTSGDLGQDIREALGRSAFLIVVCSEETAKSRWCLQEITYFKELHGGNNDRILTLLVSGEPREVFPPELCYEERTVRLPDGTEKTETAEIEPLAANVSAGTVKGSLRKLKTEFLRLAAPILGCGYDDLYRRHQRRVFRNAAVIAASVILALLSFSGFAYSQYLQISRQSRQIQDQNAQIEAANQTLAQTNDQLRESNDKLTAQIAETEKQRNAAEDNRREADSQAALARANEQQALSNLDLANAQKALAVANEQRAVLNLTMAQEQQLFRTVDYAKRLASAGDRPQAAAILSEAYDRFYKSAGDFEAFRNQIEIAMANTAYYPAYATYFKSASLDGEIAAAVFSQDDKQCAAASGVSIAVWDAGSGQELGRFKANASVDALYLKNGYLLAGQRGSRLTVWSVKTGAQVMDTAYYEGAYPDIYSVGQLACNDALGCIVAAYGFTDKQTALALIPYPWLSGNTGRKTAVIKCDDVILTDGGRFAADYGTGRLRGLDLNRVDLSRSDKENTEAAAVLKLDLQGRSYIVDYQVNDRGLFYYQAADWVEGDSVYTYCFYDLNALKPIRDISLKTRFARFFLDDQTTDKVVYCSGLYFYLADLTRDNIEDDAVRLGADFITDYVTPFTLGGGEFMLIDRLNRGTNYVYNKYGNLKRQLDMVDAPVSRSCVSHGGKTVLLGTDLGTVWLLGKDMEFSYADPIGNSGLLNYLSDSGFSIRWDIDSEENYINKGYDISTGETYPQLEETKNHGFEAFGITSGGLVFGSSADTQNGIILLWDIRTGEITDRLKVLNQWIMDEKFKPDQCKGGISPDGRFIVAATYYRACVYSVETGRIVYTFSINDSCDFTGIENDGRTVWMMGSRKGTVLVVDAASGEVTKSRHLNFPGNAIREASVNLRTGRVVLVSGSAGSSTAVWDAGVYSLESGEPLMSLSDILSANTYDWQPAPAAGLVLEAGSRRIAIPGFSEILADTRKLGAARTLTPAERRECGLSIFDY